MAPARTSRQEGIMPRLRSLPEQPVMRDLYKSSAGGLQRGCRFTAQSLTADSAATEGNGKTDTASRAWSAQHGGRLWCTHIRRRAPQ